MSAPVASIRGSDATDALPRVAADFDARLATLSWSGVVEHVFAGAAIVRSDRTEPRLALLAPGRPLLPWSVAARGPKPALGTRVALDSGRLRIGLEPDILLAGKGTILFVEHCGPAKEPPRLPPLALPAATLSVLDGLVSPARTFDERLSLHLAQGLSRLCTLLFCGEASPALLRPAVEALAGLGPGSTPSGDDALVGLAASARVLAARAGVDALGRALLAVEGNATTETSREMLEQAAQGFFPAPLVRLAEALRQGSDEAAWAGIVGGCARLGSRSGADMLAGALFPLVAGPRPAGGDRA